MLPPFMWISRTFRVWVRVRVRARVRVIGLGLGLGLRLGLPPFMWISRTVVGSRGIHSYCSGSESPAYPPVTPQILPPSRPTP
eukprot:scaffold47417_cov56-Phaeocystis_antarctica.AAC.3